MKSIAIMQPTFLPWIGYLAMIDRVDLFVFLDTVQFNKRSWQQRNKIKTHAGEKLITVPVITKGRREQLIKDVQINTSEGVLNKISATINQSYSKARYFNELESHFLPVLSGSIVQLADLNISLIESMITVLGINTEIVRSSDLSIGGMKDNLLANICEHFSCDVYLSAPGSSCYIDDSKEFSSRGIDVRYHDYKHPIYNQLYGDFIPYMSSIDLLFNEGGNSLEIVRKGVIA